MPGGDTLLVFYVCGHTFCYCDLNDLRVVVKCPPERIPELLDTAGGVTPPRQPLQRQTLDRHRPADHRRRTAQRAGRRVV